VIFRLILTGLLLSPLFTAGTVHAQQQDFSCDVLENAEPVSRYAEAVLQRADDGLEYAREADPIDNALELLPGWMLTVASTWSGLTDTEIQRVLTVDELINASACLQLDLALIDCKIDEVRAEQREQTSRKALFGIARLNALVEFLNERRGHLQTGALDAGYIDPTWGNLYAFDNPEEVWCAPPEADQSCERKDRVECEEAGGTSYETWDGCMATATLPSNASSASSSDTGIMCPFDANYAPPFDSGFGCDIETMEEGSRQDYEPIRAELDALRLISNELNESRESAVKLLELQKEIDNLFGVQSTVPPPPPPRTHLNAFGCGWMGGYCDDDEARRCVSDLDCEANVSCEYPQKLCEDNRAIRCDNDDQCGDFGPCIDTTKVAQERALRGAFSIDKDQIGILTTFLNVRSLQDVSRAFTEDFSAPNELPASNDDLIRQRTAEFASPFFRTIVENFRTTIQSWSRTQSQLDALIYPEAVDGPLEAAHSLSDLHAAVSEFSRQASTKQGVRDFVTRFAYFLRLTCWKRQCGELLERAIRLSTTDECFPYANGEYLTDNESDPRWEKCKDAAGIE
jgi:hypothetical protein